MRQIFSLSPGKVSTVEMAIDWLQSQLGFSVRKDYIAKLHDFMHIIAGAVSGAVADEKRAAITEEILLGASPVFLDVEKGFLRRRSLTYIFTAENVGGQYAKNAEEELLKLRNTTTDDDVLKEIQLRLAASDLTNRQIKDAANRARDIDLFFKNAHDGYSLIDFRLSDIFAMTLSKFGIVPEINGAQVEFAFRPF